MDYTDWKTLLNILKPKSGDPPLFGTIPFDTLIFDTLKSSPEISQSREPKILILCGPPGSGKTMTLMSTLKALPDF
jgi:type II secretory ATPase GspE/PulE/Tfp pilus assembly ATPase PilB-like protein